MYIVKAEPDQVEKIVDMSIRAFETDVNVGGAKGDCPPGFDSVEWHEQMAREGHLYQAMIGNDPVGAAIVFPDETGKSVYIGRIFIDSIYHRKGYGIRLMECIEMEFPCAAEFDLDTPCWNERTNAFYKRLGYQIIKVEDGFVFFRKRQTIMHKIMLKQLSLDMGKPEYDMLQGISAVENGFTNPAYDLSYDEYKEWLRITDNNSRGIDLPEGWIPFTTYFLYIDDIPVGYGRVRHSSSGYLETVVGAGNLGYGIAKGYRGKGYGSVLFQELLKKCKEIGYKEIKLFPMKNNTPSVNIMLKNGGQIIGDFKSQKHIIRIPLESCDWCNLSEKDKQFQVYEGRSWSVFLSDEQDYIGRCILVLKRHCNSLSEMTDDEWEELRDLVCKVEACLKDVLGATLCNWSCLMNDFYKAAAPDPHLHIHVRPRYDKPVILNVSTYTDSEFGHHYALNKNGDISPEDKEEVFIRIKEWLNH